ncbi:hypothetical protein OHA25_22680 [Nonomuraea sp. NBC_00507]|uniref:hypothetical protein n=1 Tax=Nonomuraea sp. NBC_00507 TaxID=2976002 RepID=UPI002E172DC0
MTQPDEEETLRLAPEEIDMHRSQLDNRGGSAGSRPTWWMPVWGLDPETFLFEDS